MIVAIDTIKREARAAQAAGQSPDFACRFPFDSAAGRTWTEAYEAASLKAAQRMYDEAIAESSCIN